MLTPSIHRRILTKAETKRQRKYKSLTAVVAAWGDGHAKHAFAFDDAPLSTARMVAATPHRTPVACVSVGADWQFPIPVTHLTHGPRDAHAARRCAPLPGKNAEDRAAETPSAVLTAVPWCEGRGGRWTARESVPVPVLAVVPPSPLLVSRTYSNEAVMVGKSAIKEGFA